jgi:hypothetical protein
MYLKQPCFGQLPLVLLHERFPFLHSILTRVCEDPADREAVAILYRLLALYGEMATRRRATDRLMKARRGAEGPGYHVEYQLHPEVDPEDLNAEGFAAASEPDEDAPEGAGAETHEEAACGLPEVPPADDFPAVDFQEIARRVRIEMGIRCGCHEPNWDARVVEWNGESAVIAHYCEVCTFSKTTTISMTDLPPVPARHCSGKVAIVGHTPQKSGDILDLGYLKCIDTFCHGGGWLTALEVRTGKVWQANLAGGCGTSKKSFQSGLEKPQQNPNTLTLNGAKSGGTRGNGKEYANRRKFLLFCVLPYAAMSCVHTESLFTMKLSIRWLRVRVPSPSLEKRPEDQEKEGLLALAIFSPPRWLFPYAPLFTGFHKPGTRGWFSPAPTTPRCGPRTSQPTPVFRLPASRADRAATRSQSLADKAASSCFSVCVGGSSTWPYLRATSADRLARMRAKVRLLRARSSSSVSST